MPEPRALGNVAKHALEDSLDGLDGDAELLIVIFKDISDGDNDTSAAKRATAQLLRNNGRLAGVINHMLRGNLQAAEDAAARLARDAKEILK